MGTPPGGERRRAQEPTSGEFGELLRYTGAGYAGGMVLGVLLDGLGLQRSAVGQWLVRTAAGEGESVLEGIFALRRRLGRHAGTMAEAYGWGKLVGMAVPWAVDWGSRVAGLDVYGVEGFYIPYFYAVTDQIGGNVAGLAFLRRRERSWARGIRAYLTHPVMLTGLGVVFLVPVGLWLARVLGFVPGTQVLTALETIVANLCWLPPLVGWLSERAGARG